MNERARLQQIQRILDGMPSLIALQATLTQLRGRDAINSDVHDDLMELVETLEDVANVMRAPASRMVVDDEVC